MPAMNHARKAVDFPLFTKPQTDRLPIVARAKGTDQDKNFWRLICARMQSVSTFAFMVLWPLCKWSPIILPLTFLPLCRDVFHLHSNPTLATRTIPNPRGAIHTFGQPQKRTSARWPLSTGRPPLLCLVLRYLGNTTIPKAAPQVQSHMIATRHAPLSLSLTPRKVPLRSAHSSRALK